MALLPLPRSSDEPTADDSDGWGVASPEGGGAKMTFLEHLDELRKRIVVSVTAILVGCLIAFTFVQKIYSFVIDPLNRLLPKGSRFVYTEPTEAFIL